jgi:Flp pilus assembly protein CpaB
MVPQMVSRTVVLIALIAPLVLAAEMVANCWAHSKTREACDPDAQVPEMVQAVVTTAFAWMAHPPNQSL